MVGLVLVSHSRALASALAALARQAAAASVPVACAAGVAGQGAEVLGTDAQAIAGAIREVRGPDGVLVLMDLGSALLAAETALELLPEPERAGVRLCPAPLVEGAVAAAVQIAAGGSLQDAFREASQALAPKLEHLAGPEGDARAGAAAQAGLASPGPAGEPGEPFQEAEATVLNAHGLHLRPAARLVRAAARFRAEILVKGAAAGRPPAPASSLNAVATLGLKRGERVVFLARGPEARAALEALCRLAAERFGEESAAGWAELAPQAVAPPRPRAAGAAAYLQGLPVSEGFAVGPLLQLRATLLQPSDRPAQDPSREWAALQEALAGVRGALARESSSAGAEGRRAELLAAFRLILEDPALLDPARKAILGGSNAERAVDDAVRVLAGRFRGLDDSYARERAADILDLGQRVLARLRKGSGEPGALPAGGPGLLAASELSPTAAASLDGGTVLGVLTVQGGATSHASVLVRSLGIPCIAGLPESLLELPAGTPAAMDGGEGRVWIRPDGPTRARIEAGLARWRRLREEAAEAARKPAVSRDGRRFLVEANIAGLADARQAVAQGAEGVGVLRTEFLFLNRFEAPEEEEQAQALREIAAALEGRPLTVRTLDIGGDKQVPYLAMPTEANPYLGVRGIRLGLQRPELLRCQLRAVLRAAEGSELRLLFPMVTTLEELAGALEELERARDGLARERLPHRWPITVGMMVETPSAALSIESFLERVDFVSLGTNDLTQYTLAAERGNPALAGYEDALHPAVLALVGRVAEAARARGRPAVVCGEIAGDPVAVPVLAGLGVTGFSLNPPGIPRIKETLRRLYIRKAGRWARGLPSLPSAAEVRRQAADYLASLG